MSVFIDFYSVYKATGAVIGLAIFGDPVLRPSLEWLNRNYPGWINILEPNNNILRGIPTNNQLALAILRIGEVNKTPIPPLPTSKPDDPEQEQPINENDIPLGDPDTVIREAVRPSSDMDESSSDKEEEKSTHKNKISKFMKLLKGNTKSVVETKLAVDQLRAKAGSEKAKRQIGILPNNKNLVFAGPSEYRARYDGKKGWIYLGDNALTFCQNGQGDKSCPVCHISFNNIKNLRRSTACSTKTLEKAADFAEWENGNELLGSVEIDDANENTWRFTAVPERDALFNRLIAIGPQKWEKM